MNVPRVARTRAWRRAVSERLERRALLSGVPAQGAGPVEWPVAEGGNGHFYERVSETGGVSWSQARAKAAARRFRGAAGHLLTVTSQAELDFLQANLADVASRDGEWVGGYQDLDAPDYSEPAGGWRWVTGEPFDFTAWSTPEFGGNDEEPNDWEGGEHFMATELSDLEGQTLLRFNDYPGGQSLPGYFVEYDVRPPTVATVVARHVFYNHSAFDGNDGAADERDDAAIATDKSPLLPGQAATLANVTSFDRGLNGVMVDVAGLPAGDGPTPDDFDIGGHGTRVMTVSVRRGAGVDGSDRVTLLWPDYNTPTDPPTIAVGNGWLRVTMRANERTGLAAPDVFSFGNLIGNAVDAGTDFRVNALDLAGVRRGLNLTAGIAARTDFNRDARINALDLAIVRRQLGTTLAAPPAGPVVGDPREDLQRAATTWVRGLLV